MAVYRYECRDLRTNTLLGDLPLQRVRYSDVLNGSGDMSAVLDLGGRTPALSIGGETVVSRRLSAGYLQALIPGRTVIYVYRDGEVVSSGAYLLDDEPSKGMGSRMVQISAAHLWSYTHQRTLNITKKYVNQDQSWVARSLLEYMQSISGGDVGIEVPVSTTGVLRTRDYFGFERKVIGELIEQLGAVDGGFDFSLTTQLVAQVPVSTFRVHYPRRGRRAADSGVVFNGGTFVLNKNLRDYSVSPGRKTTMTTIHALGAGSDTTMLVVTSSDTSMVDQGYPLREDTVSFKDVTSAVTLQGHADAERKARARQSRQWVLDVDPDDPSVPFGSWQMGDDVRVIIAEDELFPDGMDTTLRIVGQDVQVNDDGGPDKVLLTMGDPFG